MTTQTVSTLPVRWMIRRDIDEVLRIERSSYAVGWTEADFYGLLMSRNCIGKVVEGRYGLLGFAVYELFKHRMDLLNFAVDPATRRSGVGTAMIQNLQRKLSPWRRTVIRLVTRETNLAAQLFFQCHGFRATRVLREHYPDTDEAGYEMRYVLEGQP